MAVMGKRLACFALSFAAIWAVAACVVFLCIQVVLMNPLAYTQLADDEGFINAIHEELDTEVVEISQTTHLPQELLTASIPQDEQLRDILRKNLSEFPLVLGGIIQEYGCSFDAAPLQGDILVYADEAFGEQFVKAHTEDLELLAQDIAHSFESALRVIDARYIVAMPAFSSTLTLASHAWLLCIGTAVAAALCIGGVCRLSEHDRSIWLFSISLCTGLVLLIPVVLVEALNLHALGIEPATVALLIDHVIRGFELVFALAALASIVVFILFARQLFSNKPYQS